MKSRWFGSWRRAKFNSELEAELQFHLEELMAQNKASGMSAEEARHRALLTLGKPQQVREKCGEVLWTKPLEDAVRDSSFALRALRKTGGLNLMTVAALALGIGCSTIVFSVVYNGVLHPFPYRGADRLVTIRIDDSHQGTPFRAEFHLEEITAFRKQSRSFEDIVGYSNWYVGYAHEHRVEVLHGGALTPNAMDFFGMRPLLGRVLAKADFDPGAPGTVLLNYRFWKRQFGGDRQVLGKQMMLDGHPRTIVGIMPRRFQVLGADVWLPEPWTTNRVLEQNEPGSFWATAILKEGVDPETGAADLTVIGKRLARLYADDYPKQFVVAITPLSDAVVADFKRTLVLLAAAVALLLALSCSNAASLLLVRASARFKEMAVRAALGASRGRLVRQSLIETLVLALAGCAVGCGIAFLGLKALTAMLPARFVQIPMEASISLNRPTLLFAIAISLMATLLAGVAPAVYAGRGRVQPQLGSAGVGVNASFAGAGFRSALVVCQVGLSMVLLTFAGFTVRTFLELTRADLGVRVTNVFEGRIHFPKGKYETAQQKREYIDQLLAKLSALPGVTSAAESIGRPVDGGPESDVRIPGKLHTEAWKTMFEACSEGYFRTLGLRLLHGRLLSAEDVASGRLVAVVNQKLASRYFANEDPLGKQISFNMLEHLPGMPQGAHFEIVGVVSDFHNKGVISTPIPEAFVPYSFTGYGDRGILVRTAIKPAAIQGAVERILWDMDPEIVLADASTLENFMSESVYAKPRFTLVALGICASVGLFLAVIGTFSVMAYSVSLRSREIGIRMALGAHRSRVLQLILQKGTKLVGTGILLGLVITWLFTPAAGSPLRDTSSFDVLTVFCSAALLSAAGLIACYLPALRATRVDASTTLRCE